MPHDVSVHVSAPAPRERRTTSPPAPRQRHTRTPHSIPVASRSLRENYDLGQTAIAILKDAKSAKTGFTFEL